MNQTVYTLSIKDKISFGVDCIERHVVIENARTYGQSKVESYNPNQETGQFNSNGPFDTSFSIIHPFRNVAKYIARENNQFGDVNIEYDNNITDSQRKLFENILNQEFELKFKEVKETKLLSNVAMR